MPCRFGAQSARLAAPHLHGNQSMIHAIGSVIPASDECPQSQLISRAIEEETPIRKIGVFGWPGAGPDLEEFAPAALVCGSRFDEVGAQAIQVLSGHCFGVHHARSSSVSNWHAQDRR